MIYYKMQMLNHGVLGRMSLNLLLAVGLSTSCQEYCLKDTNFIVYGQEVPFCLKLVRGSCILLMPQNFCSLLSCHFSSVSVQDLFRLGH